MADSARIEELRRRVQLDPASIAFAALAEEYRRAGRYEDAVATCQAGLQRHPAYLSARVTLGRSLLEMGRYEEAREELEHVLRAAPENLAAIRGLAEIHHRHGDLPEALEQYRATAQEDADAAAAAAAAEEATAEAPAEPPTAEAPSEEEPPPAPVAPPERIPIRPVQLSSVELELSGVRADEAPAPTLTIEPPTAIEPRPIEAPAIESAPIRLSPMPSLDLEPSGETPAPDEARIEPLRTEPPAPIDMPRSIPLAAPTPVVQPPPIIQPPPIVQPPPVAQPSRVEPVPVAAAPALERRRVPHPDASLPALEKFLADILRAKHTSARGRVSER